MGPCRTGPTAHAQLAEDLIHYLSALGQRRPDLMPVDQLGRRRPVVPGP